MNPRTGAQGSTPLLVFMRGIQSCGKSTTAERIAGEGGIVIAYDEFYYKHVGSDPTSYDYSHEFQLKARKWHLSCVRSAIAGRRSPIVLDDDNRPTKRTRAILGYALMNGYRVEMREPDAPWWPTVRRLLAEEPRHSAALDDWARKLSTLNQHGVSKDTVRRRMEHWNPNLTLLDLLRHGTT